MGHTILVVELLTYNLKREYQVLQAPNGEKALDMAKICFPDLILLDIIIPLIDGVEVCRRIREDKILNNCSIIFLTARSEEYSEIAAFDAGADDYIIKPNQTKSIAKSHQLIL